MDDLVKQALADRIKEHDAAFTNLHREYDRRGDRIDELEAKLVKTVAFIEFLDENYRHVWGETAWLKIRSFHAELTGGKDDTDR